MTTNKAIRIAIIERDLLHEKVAKLAKIHPTRLSQIIRGRVTATESERLRIAGVLHKSVSDLFSDEAVAS